LTIEGPIIIRFGGVLTAGAVTFAAGAGFFSGCGVEPGDDDEATEGCGVLPILVDERCAKAILIQLVIVAILLAIIVNIKIMPISFILM
jgi:hypothetical protein